MSPSENEDDAKTTGFQREPLCLFCFPEEGASNSGQTYTNTFPKKEPNIRFSALSQQHSPPNRKVQEVKNKVKEEFWSRKRIQARIRRRKMKDPIRNMKTYLFVSENSKKVSEKPNLPSLIEVLEVVKDAWPSPSSRKKSLLRQDDQAPFRAQCPISKAKMKCEDVNTRCFTQLLNRRFSMPEELMRKFSVFKQLASEESETNKTVIEGSPSSSSLETTETVRKVTSKEIQPEMKPTRGTTDACQQTSEPEQPIKTDPTKRVTQNDYYNQGKKIIKIKYEKGCTCRRKELSSTPGSVKGETDDSGTSDSIPSSSPTQLPKRESSSENLSSESDYLRCTCTELTSTSTDLFRSGKSTLSQTISDKSISTQDSTVSINSVSTRGSTDSDNSDFTTPEKRTSAKETTTSPDYSPKTPRNTKKRRCYHEHKKTCPRYVEPKHSRCRRKCPVHSEYSHTNTVNSVTNTDNANVQEAEREVDFSKNSQSQAKTEVEILDRYKWARLSQEELYMMQQLRHRRFVENQRLLTLLSTSDADSISVYGTGNTYKQTENIDDFIMIPRYSALPRTLSMLVNTSSPDSSHNSDSDNQSFADSLEDQPTTHIHKLYFDTKKESKPVRGDVSLIQDKKSKPRKQRGRAFFVSIKDPYGEDEMLENIEKIPQPPEKIKNQIFERHLSLCSKHKHLHENKVKGIEGTTKKRKEKRTEAPQNKKEKNRIENLGEKIKRNDENQPKRTVRLKKDKSRSKIPVLISGRSTSSSPEGEPKEKPPRPKARLHRETQQEELTDPLKPSMEFTQILEIPQTGAELSLQKPQAVIHPSVDHKSNVAIPPLVSPLRIPPFRSFNKQLVLPARKSPVGKFRQRFEVIPEEKSSSLSSAEEKNPRDVLPKFGDASKRPVPSEKTQFNSCSNVNEIRNVIVAKFSNKQLETLPCVNNDGQKIFLLSKSPNSTKGRDALIAMNQEDFNRLAKGWMNFFKINECGDNSENEGGKSKRAGESKPIKEIKCFNDTKPKDSELEEPVRFHSSNTILKPQSVPADSGKTLKLRAPLPESELSSQSSWKVHNEDILKKNRNQDEESDTDSTDYMEPPSPRVPPLQIGDIPSDATLSSTDMEIDEPKPQVTTLPLKCLQFKKRMPTNKTRLRKENNDTFRYGKKKNSGWSVTVAGTVELSRSAPDLEMRLSFPVKACPPVVSQSDSGFAEDSNHFKLSESFQDLSLHTARRDSATGMRCTKQQWMVTVENSQKGVQEQAKQRSKSLRPPDMGRERDVKKEFKDVRLEENLKRIVERKIWPKVKQVIRKEFLTGSGRIFIEMSDGDDDESGLSVIGSAVSLERKHKSQTMTEKDVARRYTSRIKK